MDEKGWPVDLTQLPLSSVSPLHPPGSDNGETLDLGSGDLGSSLRSASHWLRGLEQITLPLLSLIKLLRL